MSGTGLNLVLELLYKVMGAGVPLAIAPSLHVTLTNSFLVEPEYECSQCQNLGPMNTTIMYCNILIW